MSSGALLPRIDMEDNAGPDIRADPPTVLASRAADSAKLIFDPVAAGKIPFASQPLPSPTYSPSLPEPQGAFPTPESDLPCATHAAQHGAGAQEHVLRVVVDREFGPEVVARQFADAADETVAELAKWLEQQGMAAGHAGSIQATSCFEQI